MKDVLGLENKETMSQGRIKNRSLCKKFRKEERRRKRN
jgi:hypothetical protein